MTVALAPFTRSLYAIYGVPLSIASEVYAACTSENHIGPTVFHESVPLSYFMTVALFQFALSVYATYGVPLYISSEGYSVAPLERPGDPTGTRE